MTKSILLTLILGIFYVLPAWSQPSVQVLKEKGFVSYSDFGAKGDGETDDLEAIAATHEFANKHRLRVKIEGAGTYYIGGKNLTAVILTDTDFGNASFIIDDSDVERHNSPVFFVKSELKPLKLKGISSLKKGQQNIGVSLPGPCIVTATDSNTMHYIRYGLNQNKGASQTDIFVVDKNGEVDRNTPIIWDFEQVTDIKARPIDVEPLKITGGKFITIANAAPSKYTYYNRGISIWRSRVTVDGMEHHVKGEGEQGAPYFGFISIKDCAYVTIQNTVLTGRKTYRTVGSAGKPVSMGSYDLTVNRALNISMINCRQTNDINDKTYWGVFASNYCKNLLYDTCSFSRFDAHMGVANATIRNSELGHMGINAIGSGTLLVEGCTVYGRSLINLRSDYGSTWQGDFIIRNCTFIPSGGGKVRPNLIGGRNSGQHDFGYTCYLPERITIESLHIDDANHPDHYNGPAVFSNFNPKMKDASYVEEYPYERACVVSLKNITTASKKPLRVSDNPYMFKDVKVIQ